MKITSSGYTGGEMMTTVAPLFNIDPENIRHVAIIIQDTMSDVQMVSCSHGQALAGVVAYAESGIPFDPPPDHVGKKHKRFRRK